MMEEPFAYRRKSHMEIGEIFFWTATINGWKCLLQKDCYKQIVINSLDYLSRKGVMDVFGFVIMPNHVHLIWRANRLNDQESGQRSFLKHTAHEFKKKLRYEDPKELLRYSVNACDRTYNFWQRDSLAVYLFNRWIAYQKLDYIHNNPLSGRWRLSSTPSEYKYSSAEYYEHNIKSFGFLKDLRSEF